MLSFKRWYVDLFHMILLWGENLVQRQGYLLSQKSQVFIIFDYYFWKIVFNFGKKYSIYGRVSRDTLQIFIFYRQTNAIKLIYYKTLYSHIGYIKFRNKLL